MIEETASRPFLDRLHEAEAIYCREQAAQAAAEVRLREMEQANQELTARLTEAQESATRMRERAAHLSDRIRHIHASLFGGGDIHALILRACIHALSGTRGIYVTSPTSQINNGDDGPLPLRVRASVNVEGCHPGSSLSPYVRALCERALRENRVLVSAHPGDLEDLPIDSPEDKNAEGVCADGFQSVAVAPVVLLQNLHGVLVVADKEGGGDFDRDDVETLLHVGDQAAVAVKNLQLQRELERTYHATISILGDAVEAKDPYTHGHCEMVSRHARWIAQYLGLSQQDRSVVAYAALLHDVGKIAVSDGVLNKPGPLLPEEYALVRSHVRVGYELIARIPVLQTVAEAVLHHHERWDGTGYPQGLKGEEIPIASRIVCVVDSWGAMVTRRSYKEAYPEQQARAELVRCTGSQFDPKVVEAFLKILDAPEAQQELDGDDEYDIGLLPGYFPGPDR